MFKLESYITPIILSYVDKYVKNARAERSQVSLWGGNVVFSNLDLRLDVLERELGLPFTFVSGHIHELHITVPWTRLNTEPILITINTIECVLRLPDATSASSQDGSEASVKSGGERKKVRRIQQQMEQSKVPPPGYVQSLINKIISNVKIVCNNLILKYVEDDIVLSLNTRWLCLSPANAFWEPAFVEFSLPDLVIRKLLQVKDMTVCLDKRDASGRIDIYQEPLLYRCSMTVHAVWIYDSLSNKIPRITRYDIRSAQMEFSFTDTQLPMLLRIFKLLLALYYGEFQDKNSAEQSQSQDFAVDMSSMEAEISDQRKAMEANSWGSWAWNVGSTVGTALLPIYWEDDDDDSSNDGDKSSVAHFDPFREKVTHFGLYVDSASFVFKLTEKLPKEVKTNNATRYVFTPLLRLDCYGAFIETKAVGLHTVHVAGGISGIELVPMGDCCCGEPDTVPLNTSAAEGTDTDSGEQEKKRKLEWQYLEAGEPQRKFFLKGSLYEKDFGDEEGTCKERKCSYDIDWDSHLASVKEDTMLDRTPAVALDMLYNLDLPDDIDSEKMSVISDLENSDLAERSLCRIVFGPCQLRISSGTFHRLSCISHHLSKYDYPPYSSPSTTSMKASESTQETLDSQEIPETDPRARVYQLTAINPTLVIYAADHPKMSIIECLQRRWLSSRDPSQMPKLKPHFSENLSCLITLDCLDSKAIVPMYPPKPNALLHPQRKQQIPDQWYASMSFKLMQLSSRIVMRSKGQGITWFQPSNVFFKFSKLFAASPLPEPWKSKAMNLGGSVEIDLCKMRLSRPQWLLLVHLHSSWAGSLGELDPNLLQDAMTKKLPNLVPTLTGMTATLQISESTITIQGHCLEATLSMGNVPSSLIPLLSTARVSTSSSTPNFHPGARNMSFPVSPGRAQNRRLEDSKQQAWLKLDLQWPKEAKNRIQVLPLLALYVGRVDINFDPKLHDWIGYRPDRGVQPAPTTAGKPNVPCATTKATTNDRNIPITIEAKSNCSKRKSRSMSPRTAPSRLMTEIKGSTSMATETITEAEKKVDFVDYLRNVLSQWFEVLNGLLIQVQIDPVCIYAPRKSLAFVTQQRLGRQVKEAMAQVPAIGVALPSIILENVAHKPVIQQFLNAFPITLPESLWNLHRDNLPWTLKLDGFNVFSISTVREVILQPISTSCTLSLNTKGGGGFALCLHADMTSLKAIVTNDQMSQCVTVAEKTLHSLAILWPHWFQHVNQTDAASGGGSSSVDDKNFAVKMRGLSSVSTHSQEMSSQQRLSNSEGSREETDESMKLGTEEKLEGHFSIWLQWTLPSATLSLLTHKQKLQFSLEDYQSSFDWNPVYFQSKLRLQAASIKHFVQEGSQQWKEGPNHGLILTFSNEISSDLETVHGNRVELLSTERQIHLNKTCFTLIFTRAECNHLHAKWREASKGKSLPKTLFQDDVFVADHHRYLSEVDIKIAPIDLVIDIQIFLPFIKMMTKPMSLKMPNSTSSLSNHQQWSPQRADSVKGMSLNNNTLPLIYVKARTIRLFFPVVHKTASGVGAKDEPEFIVGHCDSIYLSPQVDNPMARILVKPEVYHLSQPMLDIPGSQVENRQYQLDVQGIGVFTGSWKDVLRDSKPPERPAELQTRSENPALEWNIASNTPYLNQGVILMPLLKKFDLQIIVAPAIVLQRSPHLSELIAGHSVEINALTDLAITASLNQLHLCSVLAQEALAAQSVLTFKSDFPRGSLVQMSSDSGVDCGDSSVKVKQHPEAVHHDNSASNKYVPFEILITGRALSATFHRVQPFKSDGRDPMQQVSWRKLKLRSFRRTTFDDPMADESDSSTHLTGGKSKRRGLGKNPEESLLDPGYDASEEGSMDEGRGATKISTVIPLLHTSFLQPHFFVSCSTSEQKMEVSVFDFILSLPSPHHFITSSEGRCLPTEQDFTRPILQTRPGEPSKLSGIPPALVTMTAKGFLEPAGVQLFAKLERPFKVNVSPELLGSMTSSCGSIIHSLALDDIFNLLSNKASSGPCANPKTSNQIQIGEWRKNVSSCSLKASQIVVTMAIEEQGDSHALLLGLYSSELRMQPSKLDENEVLFHVDLRQIVGKIVRNRSLNYRLLGPWNVTIDMEAIFPPDCDFSIAAQVYSDNLEIFVGRESMKSATVFVDRFGNGEAKELSGKDEKVEDVLPLTLASKANDQHYVDDLRAGAFQFVEKKKLSRSEAKPYQVVFTDSPSAMTWMYPKARALTRISVFPVPFIAADESFLGSDVDIECTLEYWDKCLKSFQIYATFRLSEDEINHLDLPLISDLKQLAVSDTWRVVIRSTDHWLYESQDLDPHLVIKPQSLVSVIRVDSYYNPNLTPNLQASIILDRMKVSLVSQSHHFPSQASKLTETNQELATLTGDSTVIGLNCWRNGNDFKANVRMSSQFHLSCVDFMLLAVHHVVLPCKIKAQTYATWHQGQLQVDHHARLQKLVLRGGHFVVDAIRNVIALWGNRLEDENFTSISLQNCTHSHLRIGQADTDESLVLASNNHLPYVWRSQKARLMLRCSSESAIQTGSWRWSEPFSLREGIICIRINHDGYFNTLVISMKKKGSTKFSLTIHGLVSCASFLRDSLEARIVLKKNFAFLAKLSEGGKEDIRAIVKGNSVSSSHILEPDTSVQALKIRFQGIGTPWSGDICFESQRRDSVLVRIPQKERGKCVTVWCRMLQQKMENGSCRQLFVFSPMYMARSLLPNPLRVIIQANKDPDSMTTSTTQSSEMLLDGRDQPIPLETGESPETKYLLSFKVDEKLPASDPFLLSWGIIEQIRDKKHKIPSIHEALEDIESVCRNNLRQQWPFVPGASIDEGVTNDQPKTDVQVTFTPFHPLCNTVVAEINPWCLLVNQLDTVLLLKVQDKIYEVHPRSVLVPPSLINETFHFGLQDDGEASFSSPLQLTDQEWHFESLMPSVEGKVPLEGVCQCKVILNQDQMCFFTIKTKNENGMRVINIVPAIVLLNQTNHLVSLASLAVFGSYDPNLLKYLPQDVDAQEESPLLFWQVLGSKSDGLFDGFQHLCLRIPDTTMWSRAINLDDCRNLQMEVKKTISLRTTHGASNRLVLITLHQREGQVFVVVQEDASKPSFRLQNRLNVPVYFTVVCGRDRPPPPSKWTPCNVYEAAPMSILMAPLPITIQSMIKVESNNTLAKCHFSAIESYGTHKDHDWELVNEKRAGLWSESLDPSNTPIDHFLAMPGFGDVVVNVEKSGGYFYIYLDPFSDNEISAKDVRSRIIALSSSEEISEDSDATPNIIGDASFNTVQSPANTTLHTEYFSALEDPNTSLSSTSLSALGNLHVTLLWDEIIFVVSDDCVESNNQIDEYVRIIFEAVTLSLLPRATSSRRQQNLRHREATMADMHVTVGSFQVDNQMFARGSYDFPVILKGQDEASGKYHPFPSGLLVPSSHLLDEVRSKSHLSIKLVLSTDGLEIPNVVSVIVKVKPLELCIEDVFMYKMLDVFKSFSTQPLISMTNDPVADIRLASASIAQPLFLEQFEIEPTSVLVSLHASMKAFVGLDQSPLQFGGYRRDNFQTTSFALGQSIARHYISGTLFRAGWLVGSLEMIGSPTSLTRAVGDGIRDFVALPFNGMLHGPWAFLRGVTHGSSSLVKHVSAGTLTSVTNFASSVSRNLDRLSMDQEHCHRNELARRSLPQGVGHGVINGLSGIGISILGAIGGIAHHPIKSMIEKGPTPTGLVGGLTRGLVGVVTKPLGGAAEFVAQTGQGLLIGSGWTRRPQLRETPLPRPICDLSSSVLKYEWKFGCGQILAMVDVTHGLSPSSLILTSEAIIVVGEEEDSQDRVFSILGVELNDCEADPTKLVLTSTEKKRATTDQEDITNQRIVQFVMQSGGSVATSALEKTGQDDKKDEESISLTFCANPVTKQAFLDAFHVVKAHLRRIGFPMLM